MRGLALCLLMAATPAGARPMADPPGGVRATDGDFWREVIEPHADEVGRIITNVRLGMRYADDALQTDAEWAVDQRMRYFEDAYGMLRYARGLSPENTDVLQLLGRAADELGKTKVAIDALESYARVVGPDKVSAEVVGRLGAIYLRLGERDAAIRWLRLAQGPLRPDTVHALVYLANALAARGEVSAAIDVIQSSLPPQALSYYSQELSLAMFALAVIYDRDEQRAAAFEVFDRMQQTLQHALAAQLQTIVSTMRFAPAEDQHYYQGLMYELLEQFPEARASFATYAASGDTPWRARALEHIRAIDALRRQGTAKLERGPAPLTSPTYPFPPPPPAGHP